MRDATASYGDFPHGLAPLTSGGRRLLERATVGRLIGRQLSQLCAVSDWDPAVGRQLQYLFELLTAESLDQPAAESYPGLSHINASGLPFQWVLRAGKAASGCGFLCEVGNPGDSPHTRCRLTRERLRLAAGVGTRTSDFEKVLDILVPQDCPLPEHWRSALWVGVVPTSSGVLLKPYFNLNRGAPRERWLRAGQVLRSLGRERSLAMLCELSGKVSMDSWPVGLTMDLIPGRDVGRVKIYFRSGSVDLAWLQRWYASTGCAAHSEQARRLLDLLPWTGGRRYPDAAFTVGLEFHSGDESLSLKVDLAVTKWMRSDREILHSCGAIATRIGSDFSRLEPHLRIVGALPGDPGTARTCRFVGLGHEPDASSHLNLYLEPPCTSVRRAKTTLRRKSVPAAIQAALHFLMCARQDDHWSDFNFPVGTSDVWVTAYTLARLGGVPSGVLDSGSQEKIGHSLEWLSRMQSCNGGWAYNRTVPEDADSTAWAIIALRRHALAIPRTAMEFLRGCRDSQGWFGTYRRDESTAPWCHRAPDVTAAAMAALQEPWNHSAEARFLTMRRQDGQVASYWWTSPYYTPSILLEFYSGVFSPEFAAACLPSTDDDESGSPFDLALLALGLSRVDRQRMQQIADALCDQQRCDGSWAPSAILRLPRPELATPWTQIDGGPLFRDQNA